jgi:hypothetical protein
MNTVTAPTANSTTTRPNAANSTARPDGATGAGTADPAAGVPVADLDAARPRRAPGAVVVAATDVAQNGVIAGRGGGTAPGRAAS